LKIRAYWQLRDGSYRSWERLLKEPELQDQLCNKAAFRQAMAKVRAAQQDAERRWL
jgi:hypothetical protein